MCSCLVSDNDGRDLMTDFFCTLDRPSVGWRRAGCRIRRMYPFKYIQNAVNVAAWGMGLLILYGICARVILPEFSKTPSRSYFICCCYCCHCYYCRRCYCGCGFVSDGDCESMSSRSSSWLEELSSWSFSSSTSPFNCNRRRSAHISTSSIQ
jgi:hypothetical protein